MHTSRLGLLVSFNSSWLWNLGTTDPRVKFIYQSSSFYVTSNLCHTSTSKSWWNSASNIDLNSASKFWRKNSPFQNLDQNSAFKSRQNFTFNILTNIQVQKLYQTLASKSRPNCGQHVPLHQHYNTNNINKFCVGIFKRQSYINQVSKHLNSSQSNSEWVSW